MKVDEVIALELMGFPYLLSRSEEEVANLVALYALKLSDLDPHEISTAFELIGGQFVPSYHAIREKVAEMRSGSIGGPSAELAWGEVLIAVSRIGAWRPEFRAHYEETRPGFTPHDGPRGIFDEPTRAGIRAVGWNAIALAEDDATKSANRKRFIDGYNHARASGLELAKLSPAAREVVSRFRVSGGSGTLAQLMGRKDGTE